MALAEPFVAVFGPSTPALRAHDGNLTNPRARKAVMAALRPLDVVLLGARQGFAARTVPGVFSHAMVYLGTERELKRLGLWNDPEVKARHDDIRAGKVFVESVSPRVRLSTPETALRADFAVVLRPHLPGGEARRRRAIDDFMALVGTPFDYHFDADEKRTLFCAEILCRVMPELKLPKQVVYGRRTIIPDEIVVAALRGTTPLSFVRYVRGDAEGDGFSVASSARLRRDIIASWTEVQRRNARKAAK